MRDDRPEFLGSTATPVLEEVLTSAAVDFASDESDGLIDCSARAGGF